MAKVATIEEGLERARIAGSRRHLFLCGGPDCCSPEEGGLAWEALKLGVKELELPVMRTQAKCFRVCCGGPWLLVYPDGIWYPQVTPERLRRILVEHVREGRPVAEWVAVVNKF